MSEIEKMYENAGIKLGCCKYAEYGYEGEEGTWYYCKKEGKECWTYPNGDADCVEKGYPPFTAEKQLELIKWLAINKEDFGIHYKDYDEEYRWVCGCEFNVEDYLRFNEDRTFEEALAGLTNNLWQDLTEEEKQQVKGILE